MVSTQTAQISWGIAFGVNTCLYFLKLYTRLRYLGGLKIDDYLITVAQVFFTASMAAIYIQLANGLELSEVYWLFYPADELERSLKCFYISVLTYLAALLFTKLSLVYLFKRITQRVATFATLNRYLNYLAAICVLYSTAIAISICFWCTPIEAFWSKKAPWVIPQNPKFCSKKLQENSVYVWQGLNISTDICILITPYFLITKAALTHKTQKIALGFLLALGVIVIISSSVRAVGIARNFEPSSLVLWSFVEGSVALCVTCLISLPPLVSSWRKHKTTMPQLDTTGQQKSEDIEMGCVRIASIDSDTSDNRPIPPSKDGVWKTTTVHVTSEQMQTRMYD